MKQSTNSAAGNVVASDVPGTSIRGVVDYLGATPFLLFIGLFLLWPTLLVVVGAFQGADGSLTLQNVAGVADRLYLQTYVRSIVLSAITAAIGAVFGALLAWAIAIGPARSVLRRIAVAASGTLAQFGGVMLAFAFLATFGFNGLFTLFLRNAFGIDPFAAGAWLYELPGLVLVYTYFQIPLMVIVFLPAVEGLKPQWREACESLGGSTWSYWRYVGGPILAPAFLGAALLLFANAFSAYATAKALISQGSPLIPLQIGTFLTSEVLLGKANLGKALAFGMVVVVAVVMTLYALLQRRASRWLR